MAHPIVTKLQAFGLRHGEKVGVGLAGLITAGLVYLAVTHGSIETTPQQIADASSRADQNLTRQVSDADLTEKLKEQGIKAYDFEKVVDARTGLDSSRYRFAGAFSFPEPGAGLICDQPDLIAPNNLYAHAGRGAVRVLARGEGGELLEVEPDPDEVKSGTTKRRSGRQANAFGGFGESNRKADDEKAKQDEERNRRLERGFVGGAAAAKEAAKSKTKANEEDEPAEDEVPKNAKKELRGFRWVSIVGTLNHKTLRDNYAKALKLETTSPSTNPHYARIDAERQRLGEDGTWSEWELIDREKIELIKSSLTRIEDESQTLKTEAKLDPLVDPLPFLEVGYWAGVHIASLAPEETLTKLAADPAEKKQSGTRPRMPGGGNTYAGGGANEQSLRGGMDSDMYGQMMGQMMGGRGLMGMGEESSRGGGGMMGRGGSGLLLGGGGGGGNTTEVPAELHTDAETVMVRVVDYTVEPDSIYRYRLRIVVNNPNYRRDNVTPGTDKTSKELAGPWSDITSEISVPSDVATYALRKTPSDANREGDQMQFQVVRFDPNKGLTIVKTFDHAPGQIIGGATSAAVPKDDYKGQTMTQVDFLSRQILVDTAGGQRALTILGQAGKKLEAPASALVVRGDGLLVLRDQVQDMASGEMKEMDEIYKRTLEDSKPEEKKSSTLYGGMEGMMGGRGGMNSF